MKELQTLKQWVSDYKKAKTLSEDLEIIYDYYKEGEIEEKERIIVGVNKYQENEENNDEVTKIKLNKDDTFFVNVEEWHQITNPYKEECRIIEIQYGDKTSEDDIERLYYYK